MRFLMVGSWIAGVLLAVAIGRPQAAPLPEWEEGFQMRGVYYCVVELMAGIVQEKEGGAFVAGALRPQPEKFILKIQTVEPGGLRSACADGLESLICRAQYEAKFAPALRGLEPLYSRTGWLFYSDSGGGYFWIGNDRRFMAATTWPPSTYAFHGSCTDFE